MLLIRVSSFRITVTNESEIAFAMISGAIEVHRSYGLGLLDSKYEKCRSYELKAMGAINIVHLV